MELNKWAIIAKHLEEQYSIQGKTGKQIRERWNNHLNPDIIKTPITLKEGVKIFEAHHKYGNKWAEITSLLPGRTDNTVKNYFYATVRRHLRKLNKCLRNSKFCETFNIEMKQTNVNFLINALESGELDYYEIRKIENRELIMLIKKKSTLNKKIAANLDGKGKNINKNIRLLKDMLELIEVDFEKMENDKDSITDEKSIRSKIKLETVDEENKDESFDSQNQLRGNPVYKRKKLLDIEENKSETERSNDDVHFHDIPIQADPLKNIDFGDKVQR